MQTQLPLHGGCTLHHFFLAAVHTPTCSRVVDTLAHTTPPNCTPDPQKRTGKATSVWWGRITFYVNNVDEFYGEISRKGLRPESEPQDSGFGERFFVIVDPDGHELWYVFVGRALVCVRVYACACAFFPADALFRGFCTNLVACFCIL